jgi:hypothetical protein
VLNVEHGQEHVERLFSESSIADTGNPLSWSFGRESESQGLANGKGGKVIIIFLVVTNLTNRSAKLKNTESGLGHLDSPAIELLHLFPTDTRIRDITVDRHVAISLIGNGFEECRTTSTRTTEDETHFSRLQHTGSLVKNS